MVKTDLRLPLYKKKEFDKEALFRENYGSKASRFDKRRFERYWNSNQRNLDQAKFEKEESRKYLNSLDQRLANTLGITTEQFKNLQNLSSPELGIALRNIKNNANQTTQPQLANRQQNVSVASKTEVTNNASKQKPVTQKQVPETQTVTSQTEKPIIAKQTSNPIVQNQVTETQTVTPQPRTSGITEQDFRTNKHFRNHHFLNDNVSIDIDGKEYPIMVTTGLYDNHYGVENDRTYAFDPETGMIRAVWEDFTGMPYKRWAKDSEWITPGWMAGPEYEWKQANPMPAMRGPLGGGYTPEYEQWLKNYAQAKQAGFQKQGGTMNKIKYFQQGGATAQQDVQQQVIQLVQAAMQGDQKATETVNKIMEAAKTGDQKAMQIAQMIQEVAKQMQGQATAAKWGAKLNYIKSLKYAKGGKTCMACNQKVEMKACGGKKAIKKQGGGWMELLPVYGTIQSGKRFFKDPSWKGAGEFALDLVGDAALLTGVGAGAGAALKAAKAAKAAGVVAKTAKTGKAYRAAKTVANSYPERVITTGSRTRQAALDAARLSKINPAHREMVNLVEQVGTNVGSGIGTMVPIKMLDSWNGGEFDYK